MITEADNRNLKPEIRDKLRFFMSRNVKRGKSRSETGREAFTLIEIMVVLVIITILVTLLYTVIARSRPKVNVSEARAQVKALEMALRNYKSVYGEWPACVYDGWSEGDGIFTFDNMNIVSNLVGYNPRKIAFFQTDESDLTQTNAMGVSEWLRFFSDPWGNAYVICVDSDNDNKVTIGTSKPMVEFSGYNFQFSFTHPAPVVVFSFSGTPKDVNSLSMDGLIGSWE